MSLFDALARPARLALLAALAAPVGCSHAPPPRPQIAEVPIRTKEEASAPPPREAVPVHANRLACADPAQDPMTCAPAHRPSPPRSGVFIGRGARGRGLRD